MAVEKSAGLPTAWMYPIRAAVVTAVLLTISRVPLAVRPSNPWLSVALGAAVFALWVGPDILFGPAYRHSWIFENSITGRAVGSIPADLKGSLWFLTVRSLSCTLLVPPMEELFWRGWLMRWLIDSDFEKIPLGAYQAG